MTAVHDAPRTSDRPAEPGTPRRARKNPPIPTEPAVNFRISPEGWAEFGAACSALDMTRSEALRLFIAWFNHVPGAEKPQRPALEMLTYQEDLPADHQPEPTDHHPYDGAA